MIAKTALCILTPLNPTNCFTNFLDSTQVAIQIKKAHKVTI